MAGVGVKERALSPVFDSARRRLPWLVVNMAVGLVSAFIVTRFEDTIAQVAVLAALMPIIAGQGGNASIQTATIVVRGLALDEIDVGDLARVLGKEIALGCVKGVIFGLALAGASRDEVPVAGIKGRRRTVFFVDQDAAAEVPESLITRED